MDDNSARFYFPEDPLMLIAWRDCLMWAVGFKPIMERFASETGHPLRFSSSGINALVDKATGFQDAELLRFIKWFNENVWGQEDDTADLTAGIEAIGG